MTTASPYPKDPPVQIPDLVECLSMALAPDDDEWVSERLHASDLGKTLPGQGCLRQVWLRLMGWERKPESLGKSLMFANSHAMHERLYNYLRDTLPRDWRIKFEEQSLTGLLPHGIHGRLDLLLEHDSGAVVVLDVKTVRGRAFQYLTEPKPAHEMQVSGYAMAIDALGSILLYADREGQNGFRQFWVPRRDEAVKEAAKVLKAVEGAHLPPPILRPELSIRENKGPDSVYLKQPWVCDYCPFADVSCPGALAPEHRDLGIVGKISNAGDYTPKEDVPSEVTVTVKELMER